MRENVEGERSQGSGCTELKGKGRIRKRDNGRMEGLENENMREWVKMATVKGNRFNLGDLHVRQTSINLMP